jgi:hypothetical protein
VKRSHAERAVSESALTRSERLVMMMLLRRSDNEDCSLIPSWRTPTVRLLAAECALSERRLRRILAHLAAHGWLEYRPGTPGRRPAAGKQGGKGIFRPVPGPTARCSPPCAGIHPATTRNNEKRGFQDQHSPDESGLGNPYLKGVSVNESSQVSDVIAPRDAVAGEIGEGKPWRDEHGDYLGGPVDWGWPADSYGAEANPR